MSSTPAPGLFVAPTASSQRPGGDVRHPDRDHPGHGRRGLVDRPLRGPPAPQAARGRGKPRGGAEPSPHHHDHQHADQLRAGGRLDGRHPDGPRRVEREPRAPARQRRHRRRCAVVRRAEPGARLPGRLLRHPRGPVPRGRQRLDHRQRRAPFSGKVEDLTLRYTSVRGGDGTLYEVGNGNILFVANRSRGIGHITVDVRVPREGSLREMERRLDRAVEAMRDEPSIQQLLSDGPTVVGLEPVDGDRVMASISATVWASRRDRTEATLRRELSRRMEARGETDRRRRRRVPLQPPGVDDPLQERARARVLRRAEDPLGRPLLQDAAPVQEAHPVGDVAARTPSRASRSASSCRRPPGRGSRPAPRPPARSKT